MKISKFFLFIFVIKSVTVHGLQENVLVPSNPIITVLGAGYVGLITAACFADFGFRVICADTNKVRIDLLNQNIMPIYEKDLDELVRRTTQSGCLTFTNDCDDAINKGFYIFIAVGTPMSEQGCADVSAIESVMNAIVRNLHDYKLICMKSTVPIGTCKRLIQQLDELGIDKNLYDIASNPEFLREGSAIYDFMNPDRIIIGTASKRAEELILRLYDPLIRKNVPCQCTTHTSSEMIKYASNAFLATKISFINEIANFCDLVGADVLDVAKGMGLDKRIGSAFLRPGPGFGGSCFPKDCYELLYLGKLHNSEFYSVAAALLINDLQKKKPVEKLVTLIGSDLRGKRIALLGLAFKNNTDDIRYSPAITTIQLLLEAGARIAAYDPAAVENMRKLFPQLEYHHELYGALADADALMILTEWDEFRNLDLDRVATLLKKRVIVDARNVLDPIALQNAHYSYANIGR